MPLTPEEKVKLRKLLVNMKGELCPKCCFDVVIKADCPKCGMNVMKACGEFPGEPFGNFIWTIAKAALQEIEDAPDQKRQKDKTGHAQDLRQKSG